MAANGYMLETVTANSGPDGYKLYTIVGTAEIYDPVTIYWSSGDYLYIQYPVNGTNQYKQGYVPYWAVKIESGSLDSTKPVDVGPRYVNTSTYTYTGPSGRNFISSDYLTRGATVYYLNVKIDGYAYVEYSVSPNGAWTRAWIWANFLSTSRPTADLSDDNTDK